MLEFLRLKLIILAIVLGTFFALPLVFSVDGGGFFGTLLGLALVMSAIPLVAHVQFDCPRIALAMSAIGVVFALFIATSTHVLPDMKDLPFYNYVFGGLLISYTGGLLLLAPRAAEYHQVVPMPSRRQRDRFNERAYEALRRKRPEEEV